MTDTTIPRSQRVRYEGEAATDLEGRWIEVRRLRTGAELQVIIETTYWDDIHQLLAAYVLDWNLTGPEVVEETVPAVMVGEREITPERIRKTIRHDAPLPSPAVAGPDVLKAVDSDAKLWMRQKLIESTYHREDDGGKPGKPSGATPDGTPSGSESGSSETSDQLVAETTKTSRRKRTPATDRPSPSS